MLVQLKYSLVCLIRTTARVVAMLLGVSLSLLLIELVCY